MKSNGAKQGASSSSGGLAYGQPYLQNTESGGQGQRAAASNSNLKSYITELKKVSNQNKSGGKRGHSSTRQGAATT